MTLRVRGLVVDHGAIRAISNATFNVPKGSITAVIGANGAGKSTLLRTISGLKRATSGNILWDELAVDRLWTFLKISSQRNLKLKMTTVISKMALLFTYKILVLNNLTHL